MKKNLEINKYNNLQIIIKYQRNWNLKMKYLNKLVIVIKVVKMLK